MKAVVIFFQSQQVLMMFLSNIRKIQTNPLPHVRILFKLACMILLLVIFLGCKRDIKVKNQIAGRVFRYWQLQDQSELRETKSIFKFTREGRIKIFKKYRNGLFRAAVSDDTPTESSWDLVNDTLMYTDTYGYLVSVHLV
jgi:hypothetical protein